VQGFPSREPIFILGLPPKRHDASWERILGSHSSVYSAGELNDFSQALVDAVIAGRPAPRLNTLVRKLVARSANLDFEALGPRLSRAHSARDRQDASLPLTKCRSTTSIAASSGAALPEMRESCT